MPPLQLKVRDESLKYPVLSQDNVIDVELAKQARDFAMAIPFDVSTPQLNDTDNQPRSEVYIETSDPCVIRQSLDNPSSDPNQWRWENYSGSIWRAIPLTLKDFCGSPIYDLIKELEAKWWHYLTNKELKSMTWVLQRIPYGCCINPHNDEWSGRRIAFVYYLTPDDWDMNVDGGALCVENFEQSSNSMHTIRISPDFNSLIAWYLKSEKDESIVGSPVHWVENITANNDKPRISLVGFWGD
jgi:hypothetical protein